MWQYSGTHGYTLALAAYVVAAGALTTLVQPNFSRLVRKTQALEGEYRGAHEALRGSAEAVALLGAQLGGLYVWPAACVAWLSAGRVTHTSPC